MSDIETRLEQAQQQLQAGQDEAARIVLLEILKQQPNNTTALLMLGGAYFYAKRYADAERVYERLITAEPGSGMLSIALFNCLWQQGRQDEAAAEIGRFIQVADKERERETIEKYAEIIKSMASAP